MTTNHRSPGSLATILHARAMNEPDRIALTALDRHGQATASLTTGELDMAARSLAAGLLEHTASGNRVLLPPMPGLRFHVAFMACLYAGLVAVPVPPIPAPASGRGPDGERPGRLTRLRAICADALPAVVVVPDAHAEQVAKAWADDAILGALTIVAAEYRAAAAPPPAPIDPGTVAFLQFTSGSTSTPRGVMISHQAIVANQQAMFERMGSAARSTLVSWLPLYHDMGLCLGLLQPVYSGVPALLMEPETFLIRPQTWLRAISGLPDVRSAAPDFAYAWCARRITEAAKADLDLSGWRVAVTGAEPVRAQTVAAFHAAFADCGLSSHTLTPSYGLAEATLFVTGGSADAEPAIRRYSREALAEGLATPDASGQELVGCGTPGQDIEVTIVDPNTGHRRRDREVGEIWVRSPAVGLGYWGHADESTAIFGARLNDEPDKTWLRTGDLGFLDADELFVTGRIKDLIIIAGVNYYPHDFELLAQQAHPLLDGGQAAAVATDGENRVTVLVEVTRRPEGDESTVAAAAAVRAVTAVLPVGVDVVVTGRGQLPRTTSGKVRRAECAERLRHGRINALAQWPRPIPAPVDREPQP